MPRSLLVEVLSMAVARFLRVTRAPGTAAFDESVIVPPTLPVDVWARIGCAHKSRMRAVVKTPLPKQELALCIFAPLLSMSSKSRALVGNDWEQLSRDESG